MALDKIVDSRQLDADLLSIANAIREKNGSTRPLNFPADFVTEIGKLGGDGLTDEIKQAILQLGQKVAYIDAEGQAYYNDLYNALYPPKTVVLLTAVFRQGSTVIYDDTALDDLKQYLTVTAKYDDNTTAILADNAYALSGLLEVPSSTVTVLYSGVSTTFTVAVTARPTLSSITADYNQSGTVYDTDTLDSLKSDLVVTAHYSDSSTQTVPAADYTLSGTLTAGTSTVTVSYGEKTTTFNVTVTTAIWYQLTNRVLNNDGPILTGINFMENDVDITLVFDVDFAGQKTDSYWRLFTNNSAQSPYEGIYVMSHNNRGEDIRLQWMSDGNYAIPMTASWTGNLKLILVHQAGSGRMQYYYSKDNSSVVSGERTASYVHTGVEGRIGGSSNAGQFKGTIHEITIYKTILSNDAISAFLHKDGTQIAAYVG